MSICDLAASLGVRATTGRPTEEKPARRPPCQTQRKRIRKNRLWSNFCGFRTPPQERPEIDDSITLFGVGRDISPCQYAPYMLFGSFFLLFCITFDANHQ